MQQYNLYNVEIFDRDFNFIHNYTIMQPTYAYDYLSPQENTITISYNKNVKIGQYVRIFNASRKYEGVISATQVISDGFMDVKYKPLISMLSHIMFLNDLTQSGGTYAKALEDVLKDEITNFYVNGITSYPYGNAAFQYPADNLQKITGLTVSKLTTTSFWTLGLDGNVNDTNGYKTNWWAGDIMDLIVDAMKVYKIGVYMSLDVVNKKVYCQIGIKNASTVRRIETDLPNVLNRNVVLSDVTDAPNKVMMYWETAYDYTTKRIFYRHSDNSWSSTNTDRLTPVIEDVWYLGNTPGTATTEEATVEELKGKYKVTENTNLIELTMVVGDDTYAGLQIGDIVEVIVDDNVYQSMFTGYKESDTMVLTFGMLRMDLTKIIRRANNG